MKKGIIALVAVLGVALIGKVVYDSAAKKTDDSGVATTSTPTATATPLAGASTTPTASSSASSVASSGYKDGNYTGSTFTNEYGAVQVKAVIEGGKLTDVVYIQMPGGDSRTSQVTSVAKPGLRTQALEAQGADIDVDFISGATDTAISFKQSLQSALDQAS